MSTTDFRANGSGDPPSNSPRPPAYATVPEAEAYTRLSGRTLRRAVKARKLRRRLVGFRVLFAYEDLDRFMLGSEPSASPS